jgi:hypothetical protein
MNPLLRDIIQACKDLDKLLPLSYSKGTTLLNCPLLYKHRYIEKTVGGPGLDKEAAVVGKFIHAVLEYCLNRGQTFGYELECLDFDLTWQQVSKQSNLTTLEYSMAQAQRIHTERILERLLRAINTHNLVVTPEAQIGMATNGTVKGNVPWKTRFFYGFMDFRGLTPNQAHAIILDHKTHGFSAQNASAVDTQTALYTYLTFLQYPALQKIQAGGAYIPDEHIDMTTFTRDKIGEVEDKVLNFFGSVWEKASIGQSQSDYPACSGRHCNWCGYTTGCKVGQIYLAKQKR